MAQTKPKAAQFYGVSGDGTAGQVLISDGNGGMFWGANTENYTVSWNTPTGQSLTYTQPTPQSSSGAPGSTFPTTTFTATKSGEVISGTATIAGLPTGITASQSISGTGADNVLTVTLTGVFPGADSLNTALTISGLTIAPPLTVSYLVIAGGGGAGGQKTNAGQSGGGGGAGGLRTSYGSTSGGGASAESSLTLISSTNYTVSVGAGGSGSIYNGSNGSNSVLHNVTSNGGGFGASHDPSGNAGSGGSGGGRGSGGGGNYPAFGSGTANQGYDGGNMDIQSPYNAAGGGGASAVGVSGGSLGTGGGGAGLNVSITGSPLGYAGGGAGGYRSSNSDYSNSTASAFGGGVGGSSFGVSGGAGGTNTGGGGGGGSQATGGAGGSGIVILRYPDVYDITVGSGLTTGTLNTTVGSDEKYTTFTGGTGNIQFNL